MSDPHNSVRSRWAPWWAYVVPILAVNYLRQAVIPPADVGDVISITLALAIAAVIATLVTVLYRLRVF